MVALEIRRAIPYRKTPLAPESQSWDGPSEVAKATVDDLKVMCAWVDESAPDIEASYKLAHHVAGGDHACVWRGVAQCMSIMFGGRGGVIMPDNERRAVYDHLASHYADFGKTPPEWSAAAAHRATGPDRLELRGARVEVRGADDPIGGARLDGYAAVWDVPSQTLCAEEDDKRDGNYGMTFTEVIRKGAFARAIAQGQDVRCLWNHEDESVLGRTKSGTLTLSEDDIGLRFICQLPDTTLGRDVAELVRRGDVNQCSFAFSVVNDRWSGSTNGYQRELLDVDLYDVGPVTYPAYLQTSVAVRSGVRVPAPQAVVRPNSLARARARVRVAGL